MNTMVCTTVAVAKVGESTTPPPTVLALKPTATTATSSPSSDTPIQICHIQPQSNWKKLGFSNGGVFLIVLVPVFVQVLHHHH